MAVITYPLNNMDFSAEDVGIYNSTRTTGIFAGDDFGATLTGNNNTITVGAGMAWMRLNKFFGVAVAMKTQTAVDMGLPDTNLPRIDAVILKFDANKSATELTVKKGTAGSTPTAPAVTRTEAVHEIHLYQVRREPSATAITASKVTDLRLSATHCGLMADAVSSVDTAAINAQVKALIQELEDALEDVEDQTYYASKKYVNDATGRAIHRNLLDNSDFRNPVNQRGQSSYTGSGYTIDRWETWEANRITIGNGYINTGNDSLWQYLPENAIDDNKKYTAALCTASGSKYVYSGTASAGLGSFGNTLWFEKSDTKWLFQIEAGMTENIAWAALYEGEYTADTLPEYHPKGYMVEALNCGALNVKFTKTLTLSGWSGSAPYSLTLSVEGISADDAPHISPVYSDDLATAISQKESWERVSKAITAANSITFQCFEEKPGVDIPIQIEVNR